ncbi:MULTISPECIES: NAD(P)H-dependent oxidoreductase [Pseudomonas]|uniref:FMN dependent NADH:quinone oxidoreductase n=1 Tax=Pseudomonas sessilinigenes TaxID=658629 RepID=A0ABX8MK57_9PSED|nr:MULTISPECIES: NAD(P)H-dependent oxidoreductase [Pseudomonas]AZC26936.1 FMN-dependent NADH-azoreductase [Pseudomonas sessilinigenes]QIH07700.1 NAD(P)H dehydrogenase [Pseudomonas sp. BIOMIG1BAC]QXH39098.1 NAD(P)H-dependent oxidoreductase [Pseudomonas sessilinigenes]UMZ09353.1 NAD(P)H-dependent oxidoreductase [Pseudomonas sp. MPFS]
MKLLHVDASAKGERSNSRALGRYFIEQLQAQGLELEIDYLDLAREAPAAVTEAFAIATYTAPQARTEQMRQTLAASDVLCERLLQADACLFAMPMYNWSMPSSFKAYIDNITRTELTYLNTADGIVGQLSRQKVLFLTSRGADLRPGNPMAWMDALTPALRAAFAFIGVQHPQFVDAQPLQFADPQARGEALERARGELLQVARQWAA